MEPLLSCCPGRRSSRSKIGEVVGAGSHSILSIDIGTDPPPQLPVHPKLFPLRLRSDQQIWITAWGLAGRQAHRTLPSVESRWLRSSALAWPPVISVPGQAMPWRGGAIEAK